MDAAQEDEFYKVESIQSCPLISHLDFVTLPQIYTLRHTKNDQVRKLQVPKNSAWSVGALVRVTPSQFLAESF